MGISRHLGHALHGPKHDLTPRTLSHPIDAAVPKDDRLGFTES